MHLQGTAVGGFYAEGDAVEEVRLVTSARHRGRCHGASPKRVVTRRAIGGALGQGGGGKQQ